MASLKVIFSQILLCTLLAVTVINGKPPKAIVRGERASEKEFPYLVGLRAFGQYICGGAIIDPNHILTAGHCLRVPGLNVTEDMVVISGTINVHEGNHHRIRSVQIHEAFTLSVDDAVDIAMLTLHTPIEFNDYQKAVNLTTQNTPGNITATTSGWGVLTHPERLMPTELWKLDMDVIANSECSVPYVTIRDGQLCAKPKMGSGLCRGDSGSPLVSDGVLVGVASLVIPCGLGYPDVFTRVYHYLDWIEEARKN